MRPSKTILTTLCAAVFAACGPTDDLGSDGPPSLTDAGAAAGSADAAAAPEGPQSPRERRMLELVNDLRRRGATCGDQAFEPSPPLAFDARLRDAARRHSEAMAEQGFFSHVAPDGREMTDRVDATGYDWAALGENIAAGRDGAEATFTQWRESPGHCRNLMNPGFTELGVGYAFSASSPFGHYWTQNFGRPRE